MRSKAGSAPYVTNHLRLASCCMSIIAMHLALSAAFFAINAIGISEKWIRFQACSAGYPHT
ncbi:hypothetical protein PS273GM_13115 [Stutzerimonas stutzeri]|uniref:Uncharacterized protein n=1 Tax=Stutzerimonas stutzeri TaxID=316 RepID=A0A172WRV1_STUST|nr:hypothetical protein PS273GM_13115 [Stutzerimonas stutzeri]